MLDRILLDIRWHIFPELDLETDNVIPV